MNVVKRINERSFFMLLFQYYIICFSTEVPWGDPDRALRTVPKELYVSASSYSDAGLGLFSSTFIKKYTWLTEYEGEVVPPDHYNLLSPYAWTVSIHTKTCLYCITSMVITINKTFLYDFLESLKRMLQNFKKVLMKCFLGTT